MNETEQSALLEKMIARKNGAIKYTPMLADIAAGRGILAAHKGSDPTVVEAAVIAFADKAHELAIQRLAQELRDDPDKRNYAHEPIEKIQELLMTEVQVFTDIPESKGVDIDGKPVVIPASKQLVCVQVPPVGRIWQGIPYARNLPSLDNIKEAM